MSAGHVAGAASASARPGRLRCRMCRFWYGAEDDEYGPCSLKHMRNEPRHVTVGDHVCDEDITIDEGLGV